MTRKLLLAVLVFPVLFGTAAVIWTGLGLPPVLFLLKYGPAPGCEPTGDELTIEQVEFVVIGPGSFRMGSRAMAEPGDLLGRVGAPLELPWGEAPAPSNEMPVHYVEFPRGYAIAKTEVTNAQYRRFLEANPDAPEPEYWSDERYNDAKQPVVGVSFEEATRYCAWLSERSGRPVRLPSEAEWECACRAGGAGEYTFGDDAADLGEYSWFWENSGDRAHEVATKKPNAWGIYDLHGNVWEWCEDLWHDSYVVTGPVVLPDGKTVEAVLSRAPTDGTAWRYDEGSSFRVFRGGSWSLDPVYCRSAFRSWFDPGFRWWNLGFRPVCGPSND